jgi:hypothetical protein
MDRTLSGRSHTDCLRNLVLIRGDAVINRTLWRNPEDGGPHETLEYAVVSSMGADGLETKPKLAKAMIARAVKAGVPFKWVTVDEACGGNPGLREFSAPLSLRQRDPAGRSTAEKYRNRSGNERTSVDFNGRSSALESEFQTLVRHVFKMALQKVRGPNPLARPRRSLRGADRRSPIANRRMSSPT